MADVFTKKKRSEIMSRIRSKNTKAELEVYRFLRRNKIHFQRHYNRVPGRPDIAVPSKKRAVFINGDFWHGYRFRAWCHKLPKEYWQEKIASNMRRDRRNYSSLKRAGWRILKVWEHELSLKRRERAFERIRAFLTEAG